jgi:hypothetical protein
MTIIPNHKTFQPRFFLYMQAHGLTPGDEYKSYEYIIWVCGMVAEYKRSIGKTHLDILTTAQKDSCTEYIKERVDSGIQRKKDKPRAV